MNRNVIERLICLHADMPARPEHFSKDNPTKMAYYTLLNRVLEQRFAGWSGITYTAKGVGFHPDESDQFRASYCAGYILTDGGHVHLNEIDWSGTTAPVDKMGDELASD